MKEYFYGMKLRPFSFGTQPKFGLQDVRVPKIDSGYHDILVYDRELSDEEIKQYELERV